jgi:hypothetical protein
MNSHNLERITTVLSESEVMKDIGNTHIHNAIFNNLDTKNNFTIPVTGPHKQNNPIKRQSSKSSHRKEHMVLIIGDSHTRLCAANVKSEITDN